MKIYCDMDGVVACFTCAVIKVLGKMPQKDPNVTSSMSHDDWMKLAATPNFWLNIKPLPDGLQLWNIIRPFDPFILSAYPWVKNWPNIDTVIKEKKLWCNKYLRWPDEKVIVGRREDKALYAVSEDGSANLLIDDTERNIKEWQEAGGIAIHHFGLLSTVAKLNALGIITP